MTGWDLHYCISNQLQMQLTHLKCTITSFSSPLSDSYFCPLLFIFSKQKKCNRMCNSKEILIWTAAQLFVVNVVSSKLPTRWHSSITRGCRRLGQITVKALVNPKNCFATLIVTTENCKTFQSCRTSMTYPNDFMSETRLFLKRNLMKTITVH